MSVVDKKFSHDLYSITWKVEEINDGLRLDQFMMIFLETWSREQIKKKIKSGSVSISGRPSPPRASTKVYYRELITMTTKREELLSIEKEFWMNKEVKIQWDADILYQDDDILIAQKPAYMSTHPTGQHIFHCATVYFESLFKKPIHSIHRLDRETSGLLLLTKNGQIAIPLTQSFEDGDVKKCYFFIAKKTQDITDREYVCKLRLGPREEGLERVVIEAYPENSPHGKSAHTDFVLLEAFEQYVLGLAFPKTGRQHQIRVHAAQLGFPLIGDKLYLADYPTFQRFKDRKETWEDYQLMEHPRHALHAIALEIPYQGTRKLFIGQLPDDLLEFLQTKQFNKTDQLQMKISQEIEKYFSRT